MTKPKTLSSKASELAAIQKASATEEEIKKYLDSVTKGEISFDSTLEEQIADNFVKGKRQYAQLSMQLEKQRKDLEQGERLLIELGGRIDENARLLITAFEKRGI